MFGKVKSGLRWTALLLGGLTIAFLLAAWIGAAIPRNSDWQEPQDGVTIFVTTNGIHTEIVMPIATQAMDWREYFPVSDLGNPARPYTHVSVGWGERSFFLETPRWSELSPTTALSALAGGDPVLHVTYEVRPTPSETFRSLTIRQDEYAALARAIASDKVPDGKHKAYPGYGGSDVFYSALGSYHIANSCNQWTADRLAKAGIRIGRWTPFSGGVMQWIPDLDRS